MLLSQNQQSVVVDCGTLFPTADEYGVEKYVPNLDYLESISDEIVGLVLTHGHEDHIGAVPLFLRRFGSVPIYATRFTAALVERKLEEFQIVPVLRIMRDLEPFVAGPFTLKPVPVCHNIPDGVALHISTSNGTIFHSGDLKLDQDALDGRNIDFDKLGFLRDVDLLLGDSTNATVPGNADSEKSLEQAIDASMADATGHRIVCSTFSSNVHRHQHFIDIAADHGRTTHILGRSMEAVSRIALEDGFLKPALDPVIGTPPDRDADPGSFLVLTTGSQGEPRSGLSLMARHEHKSVRLAPGDHVIFSSSRVPGNERSISDLANRLARQGVDVVDISNSHIHSTGHACSEDLRTLLEFIRPQFFTPIHGESRHLLAHSRIANSLVAPEHVNVCYDGDSLVLEKRVVRRGKHARAMRVGVDSLMRPIADADIESRHALGQRGVVVVAVTVDGYTLDVEALQIESLGWPINQDDGESFETLKAAIAGTIETRRSNGDALPFPELERLVKRQTKRWIGGAGRDHPAIVPVLTMID